MPIVTGINANVFRAVSGSLFSSPVNWSRGVVPTGSDVAMIADNCIINVSRTVGSLIVQPGFTASINTGLTLQVNDVMNILGHFSCSGNPTITSTARKNIINSLSQGTSTFHFSSSFQQSIPGLTYHNLSISAPSGSPGVTKPLINNNLIVSGGLTIRGANTLDLNRYDLIVSGTTILDAVNGNFAGTVTNRSAIIAKSFLGSIIFYGPITFGGDGRNNGFDFQNGNPSVDIYNGINFNDDTIYVDTGKGNWTFRGNNNQTVSAGGGGTIPIFNSPIIISGSTAVTMSTTTANNISINNTINGTEASSSLKLGGRINFTNVAAAIPMITGTFDYTGSNNTIGYVFGDSFTLPYSYYNNLVLGVANGQTKTINKNLSISGSLQFGGGNLELGAYNLSVSGTTGFGSFNGGPKITKSGPGYVTFAGNLSYGCCNGGHGVDFSVGNPTVEFQNGIFYGDTGANRFHLGTGSTLFTTRNQLINQFGSNSTMSFYGPVNIENIAVTNSLNNAIYLYAPINGTTVGSTFKNNTNLYFSNSASLSGSFVTGTLDLSTVNNTVGLVGNYSATIPARFNTFSNLSISGTGIKTLGTSSYVSGTLSFSNPAIFELSSSNLFVSGTTNTSNGIVITRSGSGTTVFNGRVTQLDFGKIDFSYSNANVEFRNGVDSRFQAYVYLGSGSAIFSTNDQSYLGYIVNTGDIVISGSIRLRNQAIFNIYKTINGTSASSILDNSGSIYFMTASAVDNSMLTGSFISASYPGSILGFAFSGSYKIPFSSFRNLVLNPGGSVNSPESKTLSGHTIIYEGISISRDTLDTENNDLTILGTIYSLGGGIKKSGSGSVLLSGSVDLYDNGAIDFRSASNASLEMRGGIIRGTFGSRVDMGTTPVTFSINNQNVVACNNSNQYSSILISGSITVGFGLQAGTFVISGSLNGTDANSRFYLSASSTVIYNSSQQPMQTGILDVTSSVATFIYNTGSQDVKGGTYRNLTFLNGLKTLQGNVSVLGTFSTGSGPTSGSYNLNGFTLTNP